MASRGLATVSRPILRQPFTLEPHVFAYVTTGMMITSPYQPYLKKVDNAPTLELHLFYGASSARRPTGTTFKSCRSAYIAHGLYQ